MPARSRFYCSSLLLIGCLSVLGGGSALAADSKPVERDDVDKHASFVRVAATGETQFLPTADEQDVPKRFQLSAHTFPFKTEFHRFSGPVRVSRLTFPSPVTTDLQDNNTVHAEYYQPQGQGPFPGCVVLHILGGEFPLSQMIANGLARRGVAVVFVKMPYYGERRGRNSRRRMVSRNPRETLEGMTQAVLDIRRAAGWLSERPEVDAEKLGVTGISLGGIMAALSAPAEPRFKKVAIYLGGGGLAQMVWAHPHRDAERFRRGWLADGGTRASFLKLMAPVDPVTYGHLLKNRTVLMVAARHDEIVPPENTRALWNSIGRKPELVWLDAGHVTATLYLYQEMERLGRFFSEIDEIDPNSQRAN